MKNLKANKLFFGTLATFLLFALFLLFFFQVVRLQAQTLHPVEDIAANLEILDRNIGVLDPGIVNDKIVKPQGINERRVVKAGALDRLLSLDAGVVGISHQLVGGLANINADKANAGVLRVDPYALLGNLLQPDLTSGSLLKLTAV